MSRLGFSEAPGTAPIAALDQRIALQAGGQRKWLVPGTPPGPLVDPDGKERSVDVQQPSRGLRANPLMVSKGCVVGPDIERERMVNASTPVICQHSVDTKAFTGKGEARSIRMALLNVDKLHGQMAELAEASGRLGKNILYLTVHTRNATGQRSLRWRGHTGLPGTASHKHLTWVEATARIEAYPYEVMSQLQEWDRLAKSLNALEQKARAALKSVQTPSTQ